jgi:hypothetical protein
MVEIIPKPKIKMPFWQNLLLYLSIIFLIGSLSSYFVLFYLQKKSERKIWDLDRLIEEQKTLEHKKLEIKVLNVKKKIEDFSFLIKDRKLITKLFSLIEKNCHPRVFFTKLSFDLKNFTLQLPGETESFQDLAQQFYIFEKEKNIKALNLSDISIGREGKIEFKFTLSFSPQFFK